MSLVSLFHMMHPHSESAQEAARVQAAGTDLLKVSTASFPKGIPAGLRDKGQKRSVFSKKKNSHPGGIIVSGALLRSSQGRFI